MPDVVRYRNTQTRRIEQVARQAQSSRAPPLDNLQNLRHFDDRPSQYDAQAKDF